MISTQKQNQVQNILIFQWKFQKINNFSKNQKIKSQILRNYKSYARSYDLREVILHMERKTLNFLIVQAISDMVVRTKNPKVRRQWLKMIEEIKNKCLSSLIYILLVNNLKTILEYQHFYMFQSSLIMKMQKKKGIKKWINKFIYINMIKRNSKQIQLIKSKLKILHKKWQ
ncbi:unnamed protein product [Paramecium pentaurelia]|uniref:Uncharacterized protein n=1 Tax=Paramecium pentaurelia TaxID=43138 RepID=A0A8S1UBD8_9CILI|nr:unnamed protein product [Paramecium pentaurelia]